MNAKALSIVALLSLAAALPAAAQSEAEQAQSREEQARMQADQAQRQAELEAARAELDIVTAELERAAAEVARLSAEHFGPSGGPQQVRRNIMMFRRPVLGLNIENDDDGIRVVGVSPGGPAAEIGVEIGDLIVRIDDIEVDASAGPNPTRVFVEALNEVEPGDNVELEVLRDGQPITMVVETDESSMPAWLDNIGEQVNVVVRELPDFAERNFTRVIEQPFFLGPWRDMELVELTPGLGEYFGTEEGLLVVRAPESDEIDLRDGDVILEIGGRQPQSVGHAMRILRSFEPDETLEITIMRERRRRSVEFAR